MLWKNIHINISIIIIIHKYNAILNLIIIQHNNKIQLKYISHGFEIDLKNQKFLSICNSLSYKNNLYYSLSLQLKP